MAQLHPHVSQSPLFTERRNAQRHRTPKPAKIIFDQKSSVIYCIVRNLSIHGARLQVPNVISVPEKFEVQIEGVTRPAIAIWRGANEIGVAFLNEDHLQGEPGPGY
jgi:hypothetical protein